jgi:cell division protein FtsW
MKSKKIDRLFLISVLTLTCSGFFIFTSASLGLLAQTKTPFSSVTLIQGASLVIGLALFYGISKVPYTFWRKYSFYILLGALAINCLLFIPSITINHGGAGRWIDLKFLTLQPSEFLKIAFIIYFAGWIAHAKNKIATFKMGILPYFIIVGILGAFLLSQSDTFTLGVIIVTGAAMLIAGGAKWTHIVLIALAGILVISTVAYVRPYARQRVLTFLNPASDPQGAGYQIQQSLIAIGSGGISGRGYGQSVQKFGYLPQPIDDSIFAVQAEEFGFIGSSALIIFFLVFAFRAFKIASKAPDEWSRMYTLGLTTLILVESYTNIAAMLGIVPLSGKPLLFVSHGGTALIIILAATGIIANISKAKKR